MNKTTEFIGYARKFLVAILAALAIFATALVDGTITPSEWIQVGIAFVGALGVYQVKNTGV